MKFELKHVIEIDYDDLSCKYSSVGSCGNIFDVLGPGFEFGNIKNFNFIIYGI